MSSAESQNSQQQQNHSAEAGMAVDEVKPVPDERGPHDVPDDKVIEKTLPTGKVGNESGSGSGRPL